MDAAHMLSIVGIPWPEIKALMALGAFPASVDGRNSQWDADAIKAWCAAQPAQRDAITATAVQADPRGLVVRIGPLDIVVPWEAAHRAEEEAELARK